VVLLAAAAPANRFTQSLVQDLAGPRANTVEILPPLVAGIAPDSAERLVRWGAGAFARVVAAPRTLGEALAAEKERSRVRTSLPLAVAALFMLVTGWRRPARTRERLSIVIALLAVVALMPLGLLSNRSGIFDPSNYFTPMGRWFTANAAALILTASLVLSGLFVVLRSPKLWYSRKVAVLIVLVLAATGPFVLRDLARGIAFSAAGPSTKLWAAWQLAIALAGASVLVAGASAGQVAIGTRRGLPWWLSPFVAGVAAVLALPFWNASGGWPTWYPALWILAIVLLAFVRRSPRLVVGAAIVAGCGAVTLTWGQTVRARMNLAASDIARLSTTDPDAVQLLDFFARSLLTDGEPPRNADEFAQRFAASYLAKAGYSARIARWIPESVNVPYIDLRLAAIVDTIHFQRDVGIMARSSGRIEVRAVPSGAVTVLTAAVPFSDGSVITIAVPPVNLPTSGDPFETLTGLSIRTRAEPPYKLTLNKAEAEREADARYGIAVAGYPEQRIVWRRSGTIMHGDGVSGNRVDNPVHVEIDMRGPAALVPRGALLVMADVAAVILLWAVSAMSDGALWRWLRRRARQWSRSYRIRLSLALLTFFAVPAAAFAGWAAYRLREDDHAARELIVREALRVSAIEPNQQALAAMSDDVGASLYMYRDGQLTVASDSLLDHLSPIGRLLPRNVFSDDSISEVDDFTAVTVPTGYTTALVGYRRIRVLHDVIADADTSVVRSASRASAVVATPARGNEYELDERRTDLAVQVLFALAIGALAALWLSGVASRSLARPVGTLREAALALAAGQRSLKLTASPAEFAPVFSAFGQMAGDLSASRDALEAAQRRTEAVLQHVASGVLAVSPDGAIIIANPRAETMLGVSLRPGTLVSTWQDAAPLAPLLAHATAFLRSDSDDASFDVTINARQLNARLTRLPAGAVLTLDDVTEIASAQRVLAWGEMARQVAHEIKNPLTPIRLGVQHLRRAYRDGRGDFSDILEKNVGRVLEEIDHLDEIARAFSRYGTAPAEREAPQLISLGTVVRAVLALETLGDSGVSWTFQCNVDAPADRAWARADELKEVLINLLENARLANAKTVEVRLDRVDGSLQIQVVDNGGGIAADVLPRIFEPHFSTRTSGSGLGLAISRRLIEGWGGTVAVMTELEQGTTVRILLRAANQHA
ncbi:MAG: ATP-binding protein, partial [Gemmatimonadaceae bacterium]